MRTMDAPIARSYLFVPANRPERFSKACASGADAVIIDLEDAVAPETRDEARASLAGWLTPKQPVLVRINSAGTEWFQDDLDLCALPGVAGVVLPKAENADDVRMVAARGASAAGFIVLPLIETAAGFANAAALAGAPGVQRLLFGSIDFQVDLGIQGEDDALLYFRSQLVLLSRLAGIQAPVDGVTTDIDDAEQLRADTLRARRLGFGGKLCIHPKQVDPVNRHFAPDDAEVAWAVRVTEAAAAASGAAIAVDGKMVDRPVLLKAQDIMREAQRRKS